MTAIQTLKKWFSNFKKPTQEQFWAWIDSFWHKSEKIPMDSIEGLRDVIQDTASAEQLRNHLSDTNAHRALFEGKVDKVPGKILSSNDFTNELRTKLEGLQNVDISGLLPKGGYTGTAQNLKELIDSIMNILQSPDTELDELREIVAFIKQNKRTLDTLGIDNIAGLRDALNGKSPNDHHHDDRYSRLGHTHTEYALRTHRHHWDDIDGKPAFNYLPLTGGNINGELSFNDKIKVVARPDGSSIAFGNKPFKDLVYGEFKGIKIWGNDSNDKVVLAGGGVKNINEISPSYTIITDAHKFLNKNSAIHFGSGIGIANAPSNSFYEMVGFTHSSKNWGFIIAKNLDVNDRKLYVKQVITGSYTGWFELNGNSENISIRDYIECNHSHNGTVIFVEESVTIQLKDLVSLDCVSFRKVFAGEQVTFTCDGKQIIYTGDTAFNGGDGSTAVVSIWNNKCYIDIRNI